MGHAGRCQRPQDRLGLFLLMLVMKLIGLGAIGFDAHGRVHACLALVLGSFPSLALISQVKLWLRPRPTQPMPRIQGEHPPGIPLSGSDVVRPLNCGRMRET